MNINELKQSCERTEKWAAEQQARIAEIKAKRQTISARIDIGALEPQLKSVLLDVIERNGGDVDTTITSLLYTALADIYHEHFTSTVLMLADPNITQAEETKIIDGWQDEYGAEEARQLLERGRSERAMRERIAKRADATRADYETFEEQ